MVSRSLFQGFLSIISARLATSVISIVSLPLVVRVLGPSGYGDYAFLFSTLTLSLVVISSAVTEGVQKFTAENRDRPGWESDVVGFYVRLAALLAALGAAGIVLAVQTGLVDRLSGDGFRAEFYVLALLLVIIQFRQLARRTLMAFELERYSESLRVVNKVFSAGLGLLFAVAGYGVFGMLVGAALGNALTAFAGLALLFQRVPLRSVVTFPDAEFPQRTLLSFNVMNVVLVLMTMSLYHVDVLMLRTFVGSEQTGYYKAALSIAEYVWFVPIALETLLLHSTSSLWSEEAYDHIDALAEKITRYTILFVLLLAIGIAALADRFVPLYFGAEYAPVVRPLLWLLPGTIGFAVAKPIVAISRGHGNLRPLIAATGLAAALNLGLNAALIPRYGLAGAAVATSLGYSSMFVLHIASARHVGFNPVGDIRPGRMAITGGVTAVVVFSLSSVLHGDLVALALVPPAGLLTHVGIALKIGAVNPDDARSALSAVSISVPSSS